MLGILRGNETPSLYDSRGAAARIGQQRPLSQA
jgi:flagella synthesis protein FlgN